VPITVTPNGAREALKRRRVCASLADEQALLSVRDGVQDSRFSRCLVSWGFPHVGVFWLADQADRWRLFEVFEQLGHGHFRIVVMVLVVDSGLMRSTAG
jgi:hypothetical protein